MTAEFAVALPALLMVVALAIGSIVLATHRLALSSAAAEVARLEARGDHAEAGTRIAALGTRVQAARERAGPLHCVTLTAKPGRGLLAVVDISARACAAVVPSGAG